MSLSRAFSTATQPRFKSALRQLAKHGVDALKPTLIAAKSPMENDYWRAPLVSNRIANVLRKQAMRDGTYGTFENKIGWDSNWDVELARSKPRGQGRKSLKVPKKPKYQRTREERARKIEAAMEGMDERMDAYHVEKHEAKPPKNFEYMYKEAMRAKK